MQLRKTVAIFSTNNYQHHYGGYHILLSSVVIHYIHAAIIISSTAPITITNIVHFCPSYCATACMRVTNGEDKTCNSITKITTPPLAAKGAIHYVTMATVILKITCYLVIGNKRSMKLRYSKLTRFKFKWQMTFK